MKKEEMKSTTGSKIFTIIIAVITISIVWYIVANEPNEEENTETDFIELLESQNKELRCIEYDKETVLRYNVTCEKTICGWNDCTTFTQEYISEDKYCRGTLILADPIETEINTDCNQWGIFPLSALYIIDDGDLIFEHS